MKKKTEKKKQQLFFLNKYTYLLNDMDLSKRSEKTVEHESDGDTNCNRCAIKVTKILTRGLEDMKIREWVETIHTTALSRSARILRRILETSSRVFANGLGGQDSIPGRVIPKTQKRVLNATLLNTRHYKVMIKIKVE